MARVLIGKGTTNAQGIATMTEDAEGNTITGYTGTGAGLIDVQAEVTIDGSTVVSTPYEVIDATIIDKGLDGEGNHNDNLWYSTSQSRISRGAEYSTVKEDTVGTNKTIYSVNTFTAPFYVEFDIYFVDGDNTGFFFVSLNDLTELKSFKLGDLGYSQSKVGEWLSFKVELNETSITMTDKNDSTKTATKTYSTAPNRFYLSTNGNNSEFRFKNVVVYPI